MKGHAQVSLSANLRKCTSADLHMQVVRSYFEGQINFRSHNHGKLVTEHFQLVRLLYSYKGFISLFIGCVNARCV